MLRRLCSIGVALSVIGVSVAAAQETGFSIAAAQGNWFALQHSQPGSLNVDVCMAGSADRLLLLRADSQDIEIRSADDHWSMTAGQSGALTIEIGSYKHTFSMTADSDILLISIINAQQATELLDAMDKGSTATLRYGSKTVRQVMLNGSSKVLNSFRACVTSHGFGDLGKAAGANGSPF